MNKPEYRYPADTLFTGSSLGNLYTFARLSAATDLLGLWSSADNQFYVGEWAIRILAGGEPLQPGETVFTPASQATTLRGNSVSAQQLFFLALFSEDVQEQNAAEQRIAFFTITLSNGSAKSIPFVVRHTITFPAVKTDRFTKQPLEPQCDKLVHTQQHVHYCTITTDGRDSEARVFGSDLAWTSCTCDAETLNVEYKLDLQPGETREISFRLAYSPEGTDKALQAFKNSDKAESILSRSTGVLGETIDRSRIYTPNPVINRGLQWAKVNMVRVRHRFRTGEAFTNDPPQDIVVVRDVAWFALGSDYLFPGFSRNLLEGVIDLAEHKGGKLTEYYHADEANPVQHDYHLNINDDTPLFVWALVHHCVNTDDDRLLKEFFPVMKRACDWILRQVKNGLVRCEAKGTNVWGICSWRNIVDDYQLAGTVTEINAECYLALTLASGAAHRLGEPAESRRFAGAADTLRKEINRQLRSEKTGLYLLNIDNDGVQHHDVTGDLIFPVLAGVADPDMEKRILDRLTQPDMWTDYGARTVAPSEPNFDPEAGYQLVGGVWPNLTAWIAYCLRSTRPDKVEEALVNIYRTSEAARPADFAFVVPGEFPERFHGTGFQSRGMTLSPWTPPAYLWLGIEGLLGVRCTWDGIEMNPAMPPGWRWIAVRNLLVKNRSVTAFFVDGTLYASYPVTSTHSVRHGTELETSSDSDNIFTAGLSIGNESLLFAASAQGTDGVVRIEQNGRWHERCVSLNPGEGVLMQIPTDR